MTMLETTEQSIFKTRGPLDPVNDSAIYVPRPELDQLLRAAQATTVDAYLAILSSRQTGKSTLLYQLRHCLRPRGLGVALIDLAVVRDQPEDHLYSYVAGELRSELSPNLLRGADKEETAAPPPTNPIEFRRHLLDLARQVRAPRIVMLMDEVEAVPEKYSDAFFGTVCNIFSSRRKEDEVTFEKYVFILNGARELHRLTGGANSPLNIAERVYLKDFDAARVQVLVEVPAGWHRRAAGDRAVGVRSDERSSVSDGEIVRARRTRTSRDDYTCSTASRRRRDSPGRRSPGEVDPSDRCRGPSARPTQANRRRASDPLQSPESDDCAAGTLGRDSR
jgi:hypothetical protein